MNTCLSLLSITSLIEWTTIICQKTNQVPLIDEIKIGTQNGKLE